MAEYTQKGAGHIKGSETLVEVPVGQSFHEESGDDIQPILGLGLVVTATALLAGSAVIGRRILSELGEKETKD